MFAKPKRPYKPKVRSGCITCKIRRVKCDEAKPACLRCTATGRKCDGFAPPKALMFEICEDARERRSFHYFREKTTLEICSYDASRFWSRLVFQAGYSREPVRHALVAIGSFHEGLEGKQAGQCLERSQFTLEQYGKAIKALTDNKASLTIEEVLLSCIIFIFFENVQGRFDTALKHLESGLSILSEWRAKRLLGSVAPSAILEGEIGNILDRLHVQASVLLPEARLEMSTRHSSQLPASFANIQEAHRYFYQLVHYTCEKLEMLPADNGMKSEESPFRDSFVAPPCATSFIQWHSMLERYFSTIVFQGMSIQQKVSTQLAVLHLKIQYRMVIIMLRCLPFRNEMVFDQQIEHFQLIIESAQEFLSLRNLPNFSFSSAIKSAGFHFCIIPSLSMVACRCREPLMRRSAITLLQSTHWKEDIWDSFDAASLAERMMMAEENGRDIKSCTEVSAYDRLHLVGRTPFAYSEKSQRLELKSYQTVDPEWVKLTCLRYGLDSTPGVDDIEQLWLNRHGDTSLASSPGFFPQDVDGLFPQIVRNGSKLFSQLNTGHTVRFLGRYHAKNVFAAQYTRATGSHGDFITLSGEFTQYLANETNHYDVP